MKTNLINVIQGSAEWLEARCGMVTASHVADVLAKIKRGEAAARANYKLQLLCEGLTGRTTEQYVSAEMQWGIENEPLARTAYEIETGNEVELTGFWLHPRIDRSGASPDGLIGKDGLVEFKAPKTSTHIEYLLAGVAPEEYQPQMLWQMACAERQWCDFVSYDPRLPDHLQLFIMRFPRDDKRIAEMEQEVTKFIAEIDELAGKLPKVYRLTPFAISEDPLHITAADIQGASNVLG